MLCDINKQIVNKGKIPVTSNISINLELKLIYLLCKACDIYKSLSAEHIVKEFHTEI